MKKILYALLSVVIAIGLWSYVITTVSPEWEETFYDIPVVLENESVLNSRGLMTATEDTPKVTLKLRGNRSDLANLTRENITLVANLASIYSAGELRVSYDIFYPGNVPQNAIEIISQSPQEIALTITERASKDVPIDVVYIGSVPEGYLTDRENRTLDYESVRVTGPASVINKIATARIQVDLEGQTETIDQSYRYTLCDKNGDPVDAEQVNTDVTEVRLNQKIQRFKEITLKLKVFEGGGANRQNTVIEMDMETILVSGTEQQLAALKNTLEVGEIRLYEEANDTVKNFEIKLPEGVENLTGKNTVSVSVQFPNLTTKTLFVSNIIAKNVPKGMNAEIITKEMEVIVRGPDKVEVDAMSAEYLTVHVDFANAELGQNTYKAMVYVDSGTFGDVGAVGSYSVLARVTEAEEKEETVK